MCSSYRFSFLLSFRVSLLAVLFFTTIVAVKTHSQDVQLSLYTSHPLSVNPAYTGNFIGDWRFSAGYRNQQVVTAQPYKTAIAAFDGHLYIFNQKISAGIYGLNDVSGMGGLTFNKIFGSLAYETDIRNNIVGVGFQYGFVSGSVNDWGIWNYSDGSFSAPSGETNFDQNTNYSDVNFGLSWKRKINKLFPQAGLTLFHLNNPTISFTESDEKQSLLFLIDTRVEYELSDKLTVVPGILYKSQRAVNISVISADIRYSFKGIRSPVQSVFGGIHLHNGVMKNASSLLLHIGASVRRIDISVGYERNLGQFNKTTGKTGAFEIALTYRSISTLINSYSIPCERL